MSRFKTVCKVHEVPAGEGKVVALGRRVIAVFRVQDAIYAVDDVCPHMGASLGSGYVEGNIVTCPWHAWRFRLTDGAWADNPAGRLKIACYSVRVEGDDVQIEILDPPPAAQAQP